MSAAPCILVADDQPEIVENLQLLLETEGYRVLGASDGVEALDVLQSQPVDLILADIAMPRLNGYQLYERARQDPRWVAIPFIFLSARALDSDVRYGKELGADDYLTKPFQPEDVLATVVGRLRRSRQLAQASRRLSAAGAGADQRVVVAGRLRIDGGQHRVWLNEEPVKLSAREFTVLEYLARRANQVISPEALVKITHGLETDRPEAGSLLRPLIRSLRRKLGYPAGETGCIENVRGVGYRLVPPED
jgi:DNA-binding response OmpR family regulator